MTCIWLPYRFWVALNTPIQILWVPTTLASFWLSWYPCCEVWWEDEHEQIFRSTIASAAWNCDSKSLATAEILSTNNENKQGSRSCSKPGGQPVALCTRKVDLRDVMTLFRKKRNKFRDWPFRFCLSDKVAEQQAWRCSYRIFRVWMKHLLLSSWKNGTKSDRKIFGFISFPSL